MKDENRQGRTLATRTLMGAAAVLAVSVLAGCAGPTYGTGKPAEQHLIEDLTGALSLASKDRPNIDYEPRPGIVKPPSTDVLPPPQIEMAMENPQWPESPEQRLARVRAEATENQDNPNYRPNIIHDVNTSSDSGDRARAPNPRLRAAQREEVLRRRQIARQGSPETRRYLSDPPTEYRQPAETAPAGDPGEDEWKKERARKRQSGEGGLRRLLPW